MANDSQNHQKDSEDGISGESRFEDAPSHQQKDLLSKLRAGMPRREFLGYLAASGVTAVAAENLLFGAGKVLAATPASGGAIRCALSDYGTDTMDPQLFSSTGDFTRGRVHYNGLVQLNDELIPQPELAEEFEANADATKWKFKLRKNVKFHDGSPMTADDVIWSLNRHLGPDSKSKVKVLVSAVKEWRKVDSHTVEANLESPNADLASVLGTFHFKILKAGETNFRDPVGTGPYRLSEYKPGIRSVHLRNEDYWREPAKLEQIELSAISDDAARMNALIAGDVDMMSGLDAKAVPMVEKTDGVTAWSVPSGSYTCVVCMTNTAPGSNPDFVLGLKHLQNRERVLSFAQGGLGTLGNDQPINQSYADHSADVVQRAYDLDKAKFHLKKSGITQAQIQVPNFGEEMVLLLRQEAQKAGLDLQIQKVPSDGYWSSVWMKTPMHVSDWFMRPTANIMMSLAFAPDAKWNESQWISERMGGLLKEAQATTDPGKRKELHREMQQLVADESGILIPTHRNLVDGLSSKIRGMTRNPLGSLGGCEWPEFVWWGA